MRFGRTTLFSALLLTCVGSAMASPHVKRGPTSSHLFSKHTAIKKPVGQRAIDAERTTQIQAALISQGYLTGQPTGAWDASTQSALQKLQGDNGWQTKFVPDSRAIIKLGLGPNNAATESASLTASTPATAEPEVEALPAQR